MADLAPVNGVIAKTKQTIALALALGGCIVIMGAVAGVSIFHPPEDWNLVNTVTSDLNALALLLAGGLLGATRPGSVT